MTDKSVTLNAPGGNFEYSVMDGTVGPQVVDIRKLYAQTGMFTYDPGFTSTASCESAITYIDGEKGILLHRGYPIDQLAEHSSFMEVTYLLLHGELPRKQELDQFSSTPWSTSSSRPSTVGSGATPIRWRSCAARSEHCRHSITTARTSRILSSA
jgi:hypothetical protein